MTGYTTPRKRGIKAVYDLSATPFYLRGSGWQQGTLFQWVVSDFALTDAIEGCRYPNTQSVIRLIGALLVEVNDELLASNRG